MKIIKCWEAIKSPNFDFEYDTVGYFINKQDALDSTDGYGTINTEKAMELVQFDSLEEYELYSEIKQLKYNHKKVPTEKAVKLQEFLNNPTILQENNKYKNFIQGWEIKIQADWNRSETFGYFTNQEDGIKASHGKGWYGAHGEVNGTKPREIIVFENLDQFNEAKKENNKKIEKMSLNTFNTQRDKGLTFVGISEIGAEKELDNQTETTDNQDSTTNLNASVKGNCVFVKLDSEEAFKARAELMNRFKHDEAENNTNDDIQIDSNTKSSESPEM